MEGRLTSRELQVLDLMGRGLSDAEIARALTISLHTVNTHNRAIFRKLGVRKRVMAARYYQLVLRPAPAGAEPSRLAIPDARRAASSQKRASSHFPDRHVGVAPAEGEPGERAQHQLARATPT